MSKESQATLAEASPQQSPLQPHDDRIVGLRALEETAKLTALSLSAFSDAERASDQALAETEVRKLFRDGEQNRGLAATLRRLLMEWKPFIPPREQVILQTVDVKEPTACAALCKVWEEFGTSIFLAIHEGSGLERFPRDLSTTELVEEMKTYWFLVQEHTKWLRNIDWRELRHEIDGEITDGVEKLRKQPLATMPLSKVSSPDQFAARLAISRRKFVELWDAKTLTGVKHDNQNYQLHAHLLPGTDPESPHFVTTSGE